MNHELDTSSAYTTTGLRWALLLALLLCGRPACILDVNKVWISRAPAVSAERTYEIIPDYVILNPFGREISTAKAFHPNSG